MTHCPRPHCGGLLLTREVLTEEGRLQETYCAACSRLYEVIGVHPYDPYRVRFRDDVEAFLARPRRQRNGEGRTSESEDPASPSSHALPDISHTGGIVPARIARELLDVESTWWE